MVIMEGEVKRELTKGVYYTAIAKYSGIFISIGVVAVLARIVPPKEFGIVAIGTVIIQFLSTFGNFGIGPAIIQHKELSKRDISHIFFFYCMVGDSPFSSFFYCLMAYSILLRE